MAPISLTSNGASPPCSRLLMFADLRRALQLENVLDGAWTLSPKAPRSGQASLNKWISFPFPADLWSGGPGIAHRRGVWCPSAQFQSFPGKYLVKICYKIRLHSTTIIAMREMSCRDPVNIYKIHHQRGATLEPQLLDKRLPRRVQHRRRHRHAHHLLRHEHRLPRHPR